MFKTKNEEELRQLIREIVKEELTFAGIKMKNKSNTENTKNLTISNKKTDSYAVFGSFKPDPEKTYQRLERPRALPGWSEPYDEKDPFQPPPYRPKVNQQ